LWFATQRGAITRNSELTSKHQTVMDAPEPAHASGTLDLLRKHSSTGCRGVAHGGYADVYKMPFCISQMERLQVFEMRENPR